MPYTFCYLESDLLGYYLAWDVDYVYLQVYSYKFITANHSTPHATIKGLIVQRQSQKPKICNLPYLVYIRTYNQEVLHYLKYYEHVKTENHAIKNILVILLVCNLVMV